MYIYIYIRAARSCTLKYVYFGNISSLIHIWLNIIDIFCRHFFLNPFKLPYRFYYIRRELADKPSITSYFPSTFCPILGHHQGRMYSKSDVQRVIFLFTRPRQYSKVLLYLWAAGTCSLAAFLHLIEHYWHFLSTYFLLILSSCRIDLLIFGRNWLINLP